MQPTTSLDGRAAARCRQTSCRSCGAVGLHPVLDLGDLPLSDGFLTPEQRQRPLERFPLEVAFCPRCTLMQILETVPPEKLFCDDYPYYSSFSESWLAHCRANACALIEERRLGPESLVIELASNDGYLLKNFVERGIPVLGIDPAAGPVREAERAGVASRCAFFTRELAEELRREGRRADVVLANNVLAHVADTNGFVAGIARVLADDGVAVIEAPYVVDLLEKREFDTIYHEHLCYFSVHALDRLFARHGLTLQRVQRLPTHGGSLRLTVGLEGGGPRPSVDELLELERRLELDSPAPYEAFAEGVRALKEEVTGLLADLKAAGKRIAAYGAAAKGTILLNFMGIGRDVLDYAVDRNVHKHGKTIPGADVPIHGPERLEEDPVDVLLLLPWNLRHEILAQQENFRRRGGTFLIPLPKPELV